jgi:hypothetical protein
MNKLKLVEFVNRRYLHPRNVIAAFTEKLSHQPTFDGVGVEFGLSIASPTQFDPAGSSGEQAGFAIPPEIIPLDAGPAVGDTVEEFLTPFSESVYTTTLPFDFFHYVWFDGLLTFPTIHWTTSGSNAILPNANLLSGTQVLAQYVVGIED